jgi:hypothetical protein
MPLEPCPHSFYFYFDFQISSCTTFDQPGFIWQSSCLHLQSSLNCFWERVSLALLWDWSKTSSFCLHCLSIWYCRCVPPCLDDAVNFFNLHYMTMVKSLYKIRFLTCLKYVFLLKSLSGLLNDTAYFLHSVIQLDIIVVLK